MPQSLSSARYAASEASFIWTCDGQNVDVGLTRHGHGPTALLLPSPSSISTRSEMWPLQNALGHHLSTVAVDLPGFGQSARPAIDWRPKLYGDFIRDLVANRIQPDIIIAAGHASGYLLALAPDSRLDSCSICLISPTWRGPLPTMTGQPRGTYRKLARLGDDRVLGPLLYRLNVNPPVVRMMMGGHVYDDRAAIGESAWADKRRVIAAHGARHASIRFVTGELDPFATRQEWLAAARRLSSPWLALHGANVPPKSRAEMQALADIESVNLVVLPHGKLNVHEEYPDAVAEAILDFIKV